MLSLRARMIKFLLQHRHWLQLKFKEEKVDWSKYESIINFREEVEKGAKMYGKLPDNVEVSQVNIGEMAAEWLLPGEGTKERVILYFHGGGYVAGTIKAHQWVTAKFVTGSGIGALHFEYRLAPENPYPAALKDSVMAYQWLLDQDISPSNIVFVGDSGGGGLCLASLLYLRDHGYELPAAAVAYSPVTDHTCSGESHVIKAKVCLSPEGAGLAFGKHYAGDNDLKLPYISPLFGDLKGLPPILIYVGGDEALRDDSIIFAEKAEKVGVDVTLRVGEGLFHCYPAMSPLFPEAKDAMEEICKFINEHIGEQAI
ncbi:MAG: alpha/beta hydrolase [Halanaerobiales bacterium]